MTSNNLKVALVPLEIKWGDRKHNLESVERIVASIHPATDLVVLPETFSTGFPSGGDKESAATLADEIPGETTSFLKRLANEYNLALAGSLITCDNGRLYNRGFFIEPSGDEYYSDKHHLFSMAGEHDIFSSGDSRMKVRFRGWNISLVICYDLRFPVWCRNVNNEYDLLLAVANWPEVRVDAWNRLMYARAIENQAYVCGVDCKGTDPDGFVYDGSSAIIDFKGKDISVRMEDEGVVYAMLQKEKLDGFRDKFPAWRDADNFRII